MPCVFCDWGIQNGRCAGYWKEIASLRNAESISDCKREAVDRGGADVQRQNPILEAPKKRGGGRTGI